MQYDFFPEVKYIGCYFDDEHRMLDDHYNDVQMTLEKCKKLCYNHRYLGLQVSCTQAHFLWKTYATGFCGFCCAYF